MVKPTVKAKPIPAPIAKKEAEKAEAIVTGEVAKFHARLQTLDVVPTIVSLQDHFETIRQAEIDRVRGRLGPMTTDQEEAVEALTRGIVNKIMHTPISALKIAAAPGPSSPMQAVLAVTSSNST